MKWNPSYNMSDTDIHPSQPHDAASIPLNLRQRGDNNTNVLQLEVQNKKAGLIRQTLWEDRDDVSMEMNLLIYAQYEELLSHHPFHGWLQNNNCNITDGNIAITIISSDRKRMLDASESHIWLLSKLFFVNCHYCFIPH